MLINADVIDAFQNWDQPRVHAALGDTPYALISQAKRFGKADAAPPKGGVYQRQARGFMGQQWDGWATLAEYQDWVSQWGSLLIEKVMHPGAVGLFFGGSRTYHRLACGLEDAGWEIADCIMVWWYANGFPKSHDISKAIDRKAGAEREVVGKGQSGSSRSVLNAALHPESFGGEFNITAPATDDAKAWEGYGTALKPSYEPIIVARAPKGKLSYVDCALRYGTGALNIDGARIPASDEILAEKYASVAGAAPANNYVYGPDKRERKTEPHNDGRFPTNTILVSNEDKHLVDFGDSSRILYIAKAPTWEREAGLESKEHVVIEVFEGEQWENPVLKAVLLVDTAVSPPRVIGASTTPHRSDIEWNTFLFGSKSTEQSLAASKSITLMETSWTTGSKTLNWLIHLLTSEFTVDAHSEKESGGSPAENAETSILQMCTTSDQIESRLGVQSAASKMRLRISAKDAFPSIKVNDGRRTDADNAFQRGATLRRMIHPTIKPIQLTEYLARLLLPPRRDNPRRILIPFAGVGSEMIGARFAGWEEIIGVEREASYIPYNEARRKWWGQFATYAQAERLYAAPKPNEGQMTLF